MIDAAISSALSGHGQVVLVEGAPGLGKTSLLQTAAGAAEDAGMRVLDASGAMLEQDPGMGRRYAMCSRPRSNLGGPMAPLLGGAAAACSGLFTGEQELAPVPDAAARVLHGLYWLTSNLLVERPLMIVIDDLHWVDLPSQRWLAHWQLAAATGRRVCRRCARCSPYGRGGHRRRTPHHHPPATGFSGEGTAALLADQLGGLGTGGGRPLSSAHRGTFSCSANRTANCGAPTHGAPMHGARRRLRGCARRRSGPRYSCGCRSSATPPSGWRMRLRSSASRRPSRRSRSCSIWIWRRSCGRSTRWPPSEPNGLETPCAFSIR